MFGRQTSFFYSFFLFLHFFLLVILVTYTLSFFFSFLFILSCSTWTFLLFSFVMGWVAILVVGSSTYVFVSEGCILDTVNADFRLM